MVLLSSVSRSNWNLEMLVFVEGGKPEYPEKNPRSKDENQQQTQPTYDAESGNRTRARLQAVPFWIVERSRGIAEREKKKKKQERTSGMGLVYFSSLQSRCAMSTPSRLTRKGLLAV